MTARRLAAALVAVVMALSTTTGVHAQTDGACDDLSCPGALAVLLVGGYGTDLAGATQQFAPMRKALAERNPAALIVQYSYAGIQFDGCRAQSSAYSTFDTAQDLETSVRMLRETLVALEDACHPRRVVIVGHSLGGLIAFKALDAASPAHVSELVTIDSPLGGVPRRLVQTCIAIDFCPDGAVADDLADLYVRTSSLEADNAAHAADLVHAGIRVSAWGNTNDCLFNLSVCAPITRVIVGLIDARESQWLGMPDVVRLDYPVTRTLAGIASSHTAVLRNAAGDLASALIP